MEILIFIGTPVETVYGPRKSMQGKVEHLDLEAEGISHQ